MKKTIYVFIILFLTFNNIEVKAIDIMECEYTDEYNEWLELPADQRKNFYQPPMCKIKNDFYTPMYGSANDDVNASKFDLREHNLVTNSKYQGISNTCWTFGTIASVESSLLFNNLGDKSTSFSEAHLELATQDSLFESLMPVNRRFNYGGSIDLASAYFLNRMGPVFSKDVPFSLVNDYIYGNSNVTLNDIKDYKAVYSINSILKYYDSEDKVCDSSIIKKIKNYVVNKGGLTTCFNWNKANYYGTTQKYYYTKESEENNIGHCTSIVGWDDNLDTSNFLSKEGESPLRKGGWLTKNSNDSHNDYIYISYDDVRVCNVLYGFFDISDKVEDNVYVLDKLGTDSILPITLNEYYVANVFKKKSSIDEYLKKITIAGSDVGQKYDVFISFDKQITVEDGEENTKFINPQKIYSGQFEYNGYTTIDVSNIPIINDFAIIVKYYKSSDITNVPIYFKIYDENSPFYKFDVKFDENGASYSSYDGDIYRPFVIGNPSSSNIDNAYASIKAYTDNDIDGHQTFVSKYSYDSGVDTTNINFDYCSSVNGKCTVKLPNFNSKNGFKVLGWYTDMSGDKKVGNPGDNYVLNSNTTLYAVTEKNETIYNVTFMFDDGILKIENNSLSCKTTGSSCNIVLPNIIVKDNYKVLGWYTSENGGKKVGNSGDNYKVSNDITLYAQSELKQTIPDTHTEPEKIIYTVSFEATSNCYIETTTLTCNYIGGQCKITLPKINAFDGYTILGWYTAKEGGVKVGNVNDVYYTEKNVRLYARVERDTTLGPVVPSEPELIMYDNPINNNDVNASISINPKTRDLNFELYFTIFIISIFVFVLIYFNKYKE